MWWIQKLDAGDVKYFVTEKKSYIVSRKNGDLSFPDDSSVSRKHCTINVARRSNCPFPARTLTAIWITDEGSKYGTFLKQGEDWVRLETGKLQVLQPGSIVRFGLLGNVWRVEYKPLFVCSSGVSKAVKQELKTLLAKVDGEFFTAWDKQCTVLIVNQLTLTMKVVLAMIRGIPILTINYLVQVVEAMRQGIKLPDMEDFKPVIAEATLAADQVALHPHQDRQNLFSGKKFVFATEAQLNSLSEIVTSAGGCAEVLRRGCDWRDLAEDAVVVIQCAVPKELNSQEQTAALEMKKITDYLKKTHGRRVVPESEIAHAVAYNSVDKYCNPACNSFELRKTGQTTFNMGVVLEGETPHLTGHSEEYRGAICATLTQQSGLHSQPNTSSLRKRSHSPEMLAPPKRHAAEPSLPSASASATRSPPEASITKCSKDIFVSNDLPGTSNAYNTATKEITPLVPISETDNIKTSRQKAISDFWTLPVSGRSKQTKRKPPEEDNEERRLEKRRRESEEEQETKSRAAKEAKEAEQRRMMVPAGPERSNRRVANAAEEDNAGYITVERNKGVKKSEVDPLNTTIIMLSLVTLAHARTRVTAQPDSPLTNVKTFKKQHVASSGNHIVAVGKQSDGSDDEGQTSYSARKQNDWV